MNQHDHTRQPQGVTLASASPRRQELLRQIGVPFQVVNHQVPETLRDHESAEQFVTRLAREKARDVVRRQPADASPVVLGADTVVVCDDRILGKPVDGEHALQMLSLLSAREHHVLSAVAVVSRDHCREALSATKVEFRRLDPAELEAYWQSGEPRDKAGAYAIQGRAAVFVRNLQGSYSGVMGLPLYETAELLEAFDVPCWQLPEADSGGRP